MKQKVNYIQHHINVNMLLAEDDVSCIDVNIYNALFLLWNSSGFDTNLSIDRNDVMNMAKVGNKNTYTTSLQTLHEKNYITYKPSHNPLKGSIVTITRFDTSSDTSDGNSSGNTGGKGSGKATGTYIQTNKQRDNTISSSKDLKEKEIVSEKKAAKKKDVGDPVQTWQDRACDFSDDTKALWVELCATAKWRNKTPGAMSMCLKQLMEYPEKFAVVLLEKAIGGEYQGIVFDTTPSAFEIWKKANPQESGDKCIAGNAIDRKRHPDWDRDYPYTDSNILRHERKIPLETWETILARGK